MKIKQAQFLISSPNLAQCPALALAEFALLGRSNVGKSTFINTLCNNSKLAKTSNTPGKTRLINLFKIISDKGDFVIADLPGYGYAKVGQKEKENWGKMVERYLRQSKMLKAVFLLVDIRHDPSANDRQMYEWILANGFQPIIIATKADKINRSQLQKQIKAVKQGLEAKKDTIVIPFSAQSKQGREEIYELIDSMIEQMEGDQ